jgi:hypothetical protein
MTALQAKRGGGHILRVLRGDAAIFVVLPD